MNYYETDIFKIENLHELSANYVLFEIIGLNSNDDEYDINIQHIVKSLSYTLKHPVTSINKDDKHYLVVRDESAVIAQVPSEYTVKRNEHVYFKKIDQSISLDFVNYTDENKEIIKRFLQFEVQSQLNSRSDLWQPGSGDAFFNQDAIEVQRTVSIYNGFFVRVVELPEGGFGFSLDVTKKYIATYPLSVHLTRNDFQRQGVSKSHLVYRYGNKKYEIKAEHFSDLNATEYKFSRPSDGRLVTLLEDTRQRFGTSMPPEVAKLPDNASVLIYKTNDNEERRVIAGLCYKVFDTEDPQISGLHRKSIIAPFYRRRLIRAAFKRYMQRIKFGSIELVLNQEPVQAKKQIFKAPDILFGNDVLLSVRGSAGAKNIRTSELGRTRKELLLDDNAGFYTKAAFQSQYFVVPETIFNMYGNKEYFLKHLTVQVDKMHPTECGWEPEIITYDNRNKKNAIDVGFEIIQKVKDYTKGRLGSGYAVIMLPSDIERIKRQHDELAALVVSECLNECKITASIMHSDTLEECFMHKTLNGVSAYVIKNEKGGKYRGYVDGVAINQVLLNNERWPYILNTPLHADLTIGIDVKKQIAGFTFVDKYSKNILTKFDKSNNKEKLSTSQVIKMLIPYITLQAKNADYSLEKIVIHRDGRLFKTEKEGIRKAIASLQEKNVLPANCNVSILEIPKHSIVPFRLFDVLSTFNIQSERQDNGQVQNPQIGSVVKLNQKEAFVCTTGKEFRHQGSSIPLFIKYESGTMAFDELLEDVYYLSCLAYTKPDDCSRFPITIKITDRRINTLGSDFDFEALDILKSELY